MPKRNWVLESPKTILRGNPRWESRNSFWCFAQLSTPTGIEARTFFFLLVSSAQHPCLHGARRGPWPFPHIPIRIEVAKDLSSLGGGGGGRKGMGYLIYPWKFPEKAYLGKDCFCFVKPMNTNRRGIRGVAGGQLPPPPMFFFFFLLVSSVMYGDDDNTPTPLR